ncbi:hypothetical protein Tco_0891623 [Tanacetum coccineum]|uniref:Transposase (putative) gypsy type domain-containing protein n=1 Tax=Tanacetum coccineum TaxID=301880 RepID=A0ABQ5C3T3_9ASTR
MHERTAGKIGMYTRFFDFANFRLPLSTFLVDILRYFRINISQLSVIGAAKVSHFEILCRVCGITPTVGLFRCFYVNSKKNGWMSFIKCFEKSPNVTRDPALKATDFSAQDYAILVDHPSPFRKFPEEFLCLVGLSRHYTLDEETYPSFMDRDGEDMDIFAFIRTPDPTKVKVVERERHEGEPRLLEVTVGRMAAVPLLSGLRWIVSESSWSASVEKLFDEGEWYSGGARRIPIEWWRWRDTDVAEPLRLILLSGAATTVTLTSGPAAVVQEKNVKPSMFAAVSSSAGGDPNAGVFSDLALYMTNGSRLDDDHVCCEMVDEFAPPKFFASIRGMDNDQLFTEFNVGAARQVSLSAEVRMRVEYNIKEKRKLKTVVDEQADLRAEAAEAIHLHAEAFSFAATKKSLWDEVNALNGCNLILEKECDALDVKMMDLETVIVSKERELSDSNAQLTCIKSQNDNLANQIVSDKLEKLDTDLTEMALHLEEKFYPHLLTVIAGHRWLLTHGIELATVKCLHSPEYLSALGEAISKAIEKGMQDGLAVGITYGLEGRVLTDVAAYNPSAKADYISVLQQLQSVNFSLLAELKSNKDASVETIMKIIRLEESLTERLGLTESQLHVDQLMVPIHHSPDQHVVGASDLSLLLDVSSSRVSEATSEVIGPSLLGLLATALYVTNLPSRVLLANDWPRLSYSVICLNVWSLGHCDHFMLAWALLYVQVDSRASLLFSSKAYFRIRLNVWHADLPLDDTSVSMFKRERGVTVAEDFLSLCGVPIEGHRGSSSI